MDNEVPLLAIVGMILAIMEDDADKEIADKRKKVEETALSALQAKRAVENQFEEEERKKRNYIRCDCDMAKQAVEHDYFGPTPIFEDHQFTCFLRLLGRWQLLETCFLAVFFVTDVMLLVV
jgi:hypothetical protein